MPNKNAANKPTRVLNLAHLHMHTTACMLAAAATPMALDPNTAPQIQGLVKSLADEMQRGIDAYQQSTHDANRPPQQTVWQSGATTLQRFNDNNDGAKILLIPSLINRADILNLDAGHSFTEFLAGQGFDVYTLNWGSPDAAESTFDINAYITQRLLPALNHINGKVHIIGYCMGGTIATAAAVICPDKIASLTMLATPWDFHAPDQTLSLRMQAFLATATPVMTTKGVLPVDWIQLLFTAIDPLFAFNKFRKFRTLSPESDEARRFVIVEDWLNNGVPLTALAAYQALHDWYIQNQPMNGVWTIDAHLISDALITCPTCIIAPSKDRLVPTESAFGFMQQNESVKRMSPPLGHIGMMVSPKAKAQVWEPLANWLCNIALHNN